MFIRLCLYKCIFLSVDAQNILNMLKMLKIISPRNIIDTDMYAMFKYRKSKVSNTLILSV